MVTFKLRNYLFRTVERCITQCVDSEKEVKETIIIKELICIYINEKYWFNKKENNIVIIKEYDFLT